MKLVPVNLKLQELQSRFRAMLNMIVTSSYLKAVFLMCRNRGDGYRSATVTLSKPRPRLQGVTGCQKHLLFKFPVDLDACGAI